MGLYRPLIIYFAAQRWNDSQSDTDLCVSISWGGRERHSLAKSKSRVISKKSNRKSFKRECEPEEGREYTQACIHTLPAAAQLEGEDTGGGWATRETKQIWYQFINWADNVNLLKKQALKRRKSMAVAKRWLLCSECWWSESASLSGTSLPEAAAGVPATTSPLGLGVSLRQEDNHKR